MKQNHIQAGARDRRELESGLTAGDVARLIHVDLKTIHNWVRQGHVAARRTEGRHLRFDRVEVVRFLRRFGYPVPPPLGRPPPRVLLSRGRTKGTLTLRGLEHSVTEGLFAPVLEVLAGKYEVLVLELDGVDASLTRELVRALRARPDTRGVSVVGLSRRPDRRRDFVRNGGDVGLAPGKGADIVQAAKWLTGATEKPPAKAVTREAERRASS